MTSSVDAPVTAALVVGLLAGLAVAVPVGPVGVLLLREGLLRGTRVAVGAALGVATVDAAYAVVAVLVGVPVGRVVGEHATAVRLVSATVLLAVGVAGAVGVLRSRRGSAPVPESTDQVAATPGPVGGAAVRAYGRFVALTAVNPATAVTFATVAVGAIAGLAATGDASVVAGAASAGQRPGPAVAGAFVLGVALASVGWQLVLALGGGLLGGRLGERGRTIVSLGGSLVVVGLAAAVAVG